VKIQKFTNPSIRLAWISCRTEAWRKRAAPLCHLTPTGGGKGISAELETQNKGESCRIVPDHRGRIGEMSADAAETAALPGSVGRQGAGVIRGDCLVDGFHVAVGEAGVAHFSSVAHAQEVVRRGVGRVAAKWLPAAGLHDPGRAERHFLCGFVRRIQRGHGFHGHQFGGGILDVGRFRIPGFVVLIDDGQQTGAGVSRDIIAGEFVAVIIGKGILRVGHAVSFIRVRRAAEKVRGRASAEHADDGTLVECHVHAVDGGYTRAHAPIDPIFQMRAVSAIGSGAGVDVVIIAEVKDHAEAELFDAVDAKSLLRLLFRLGERGQKHGGKDGDNGNNHQEFDKGECFEGALHGFDLHKLAFFGWDIIRRQSHTIRARRGESQSNKDTT